MMGQVSVQSKISNIVENLISDMLRYKSDIQRPTPETPVTSEAMDEVTCDTEGPISDDDELDSRRTFLDAAHSYIPT